ncbi:hypothetical protein ACSMXM_04520 [Pacificimonas sp. ICDLI1SI03]|jgi:hypothetical protein|tara:strand:- start:11326 stop:11553 length:228 start_codon:yes stop_codon:yes gene_type:complete
MTEQNKTAGTKADTPPTTPSKMRPAQDADHVPEKLDDDEAQLEEGLEETYPASDVPSETQPQPKDPKKAPPSTNA